MLITVHTLAPSLEAPVRALLRDLVGSEHEQVLELELRPGATDGGTNLDDDVHCQLQARLRNGALLNARHAAPTLVQALHGAVRQLRQGLARAAHPQPPLRQAAPAV